jgi:hypothetical protein
MASLVGAGAFCVHQVRFAVSPAQGAALDAHGYLAPLGVILLGVLLFVLAAVLARMARGAVEEAPRFRRMWGGASASLIAVYCLQESIEGLVTHSSPFSIVEDGGWVVLPLAIAVGLAIALVMRGAAAASAVVAAARRTHRIAVAAAPFVALLTPWSPRRTRAAATHRAARGPPHASI